VYAEDEYLDAREEELVRRSGLTRRQLLRIGLAMPVALGIARYGPPPSSARAAVRQAPPAILKDLPPEWFVRLGTNAEMRWDTVRWLDYTIPNARFFVRNHTATPTIDMRSWRLRVFGSGVRREQTTFTYEQLRRLPSREVTAFVECAGNGRSFFGSQQRTPAPGSQWTLGAIGVARWRGVPLSEVLERSGIDKRTVDVMPYGLDAHVVTGGVDYGNVRRPLPVAKALDDALLAYEMNGAQLPPDHGFPLRLIVPGWVGVANVKWIGQIEVSRQPLFSLWNTQQYRLLGSGYPPNSPPLTTQVVKSAWELPWGATLPYRTRVELTGRAWSGASAIGRVDISIDQGRTWSQARLKGRNAAGTWVQFNYSFPPQPTGTYELWARATDRAGRTQPPTVPFNTLGYLFDAIVKHPVAVD
jgi:DMSO/TMAO reductase YedYZ molybdopterin-dependent catalytic subunit